MGCGSVPRRPWGVAKETRAGDEGGDRGRDQRGRMWLSNLVSPRKPLWKALTPLGGGGSTIDGGGEMLSLTSKPHVDPQSLETKRGSQNTRLASIRRQEMDASGITSGPVGHWGG